MKIVSACLANIPCRFDGKAKANQYIIDLVAQGKAITVCPEQLGGLTTPRIPSEIKDGKIINKQGKDVTKEFEVGAKKALDIALKNDCTEAILKSKSPSCGCGKVYDGTFSGNLIDGDGVFCKLLKQKSIKVLTEKDLFNS